MIRFLRAFAWLRWRLMLNGVRGSRRRDALEQISRLLALVVPAAIVVTSAGSILMVSAAGLLGGYAIASGKYALAPDAVILGTRILLFVVTGLVLFMPIGGAAQTTGTKYSRLLLLPISARSLHLVEVLAGLADPWIFFSLPGIGLFAIGLAAGGRADLAGVAFAAGLALVIVLASLASLVSFLVSWLFRDRRRAELLTIIFVMSISVVAMLPQVLSDGETGRRVGRVAGRGFSVARVDALLPAWSQALPSEVFGRVMNAAVAGTARHRGAAAGWMAVLLAQGALLFWLSSLVHRRLLESAVGSSGTRHRVTKMRPPWRLPGISVQASAIAWVMFKNGLRSVRGRVAVLLPGPMIALVSIMLLRQPDEVPWIATLGTHSHAMFAASLVVSMLAIHPFTLNQFASDRTGLTLQFLLPVSTRDLVRGKALGGGALFVLAALISGLAAALATGGGSPVAWAMTALGGLAMYVAVTPVAAVLSAVFPVVADMSKAGSGGNPHTASALIGMVAAGVGALPAVAIGVSGFLPFGSQTASLVAMFVWLCVVTVVAWLLLGVAARVVTARRENLFLTK